MQYLLPELRGNIYSKMSLNIISELKYSNKEVFNDTRYVTHLSGKRRLKSLFMNDKNNKKSLFYYNLKCITGDVFVGSKEELDLVPVLLSKLKFITLNYVNFSYPDEYRKNTIQDTFFLISAFIGSKCQHMEIYVPHGNYMPATLKYTLEKRNDLVLLKIICDEELLDNIAKYIVSVDSVAINNYDELIHSNVMIRFLKQTNIKKLHVSYLDNDIHLLCNNVDTIYITHDFDMDNVLYYSRSINNTNVIFDFNKIFISNEDNYYKRFLHVFPNSRIKVFKFNDFDVVNDFRITIVQDASKILVLDEQDLNQLITIDSDNKLVARFPNLTHVENLNISMEHYSNSIDLIRAAFTKQIKHLNINIQGNILPHDVLKYVQLLGNVVLKSISIYLNKHHTFDFNINYDDQIIFRLYGNDNKEQVDYGYLDLDRTVVLISKYQPYSEYKFIEENKFHKVTIMNSCFLQSELQSTLDTLYLEENININLVGGYIIQQRITKVIIYNSKLFQTKYIWKMIFPNATFKFI